MNEHEPQNELSPLLWFRDRSSQIELASFIAPGASALRIVDSNNAIDAIDAIRGNPSIPLGLIVVESSCRNFNAICRALGSLDPAPRVIILYPRLRLLGSVFAPPDFASMRQGVRPETNEDRGLVTGKGLHCL